MLLVVYAGGTIGMVPGRSGLRPGIDLTEAVGSLAADQGLPGPEVVRLDPLIDSSSATPTDWQQIVDAVRDQPYDGYVILHGTDTLAYTASALAYALAGLDAPVIVTGAQRSIVEDDSDADDNIAGALRLASLGWRGVGVFFDRTLLAASRTTKISSSHRHGFDSPATESWWTPQEARLPTVRRPGWPAPRPYCPHDIAVVSLAPGIGVERLRAALSPIPQAVLLRAFGAGNGPDRGLPELIAELVGAGCPVAVTSQCWAAEVDLGRYASGRALADAGAFGTGAMTVEAAYAKLMFLLSQGVPARQMPAEMARDIAGELG